MKKIMITGVNGFIGQHIAQKAIENDFCVVGIDLPPVSVCPNITYFQRNMLTESVEDILIKCEPDVIIHCAGLADVNYSMQFPESDFYANVAITRKLLFSIKNVNLKCRFIYMSSAAVYGQPKALPIIESTELNPISPYALHKKMAEDICIYCVKQCDIDIVILRVFSVYGPGLKKQLFWDMGQKLRKTGRLNLYGTGRESRDYIYIDDLTNIIMVICNKKERLQHVVYNVANGKEEYIKDIAELFAQYSGYSKDIIQFDQHQKEGNPINWRADISRLEEFDYCRNTSMEQGIKHYIDWLKQEER